MSLPSSRSLPKKKATPLALVKMIHR